MALATQHQSNRYYVDLETNRFGEAHLMVACASDQSVVWDIRCHPARAGRYTDMAIEACRKWNATIPTPIEGEAAITSAIIGTSGAYSRETAPPATAAAADVAVAGADGGGK